MRHARLWSCAHVHVPWVREQGCVQIYPLPRYCKKNPQPFILLRLPGTLVHTGLARSATPASELTKAQPGSPPHAFFRLSTPIPQARGGCRLYPSPLNTGNKVKPQVKGGNGALVGGGKAEGKIPVNDGHALRSPPDVTRLFGTTAGPPDAIPKANSPASSPVDTLRSPEGASSSGPPEEAFLRANSSLHRLDFPQNAPRPEASGHQTPPPEASSGGRSGTSPAPESAFFCNWLVACDSRGCSVVLRSSLPSGSSER